MRLKIKSMLVMLFISFISSIYSQNEFEKDNSQKDWDYFSRMKMVLYATPEEKARFENPSLLEYSKFIDDVYSKRSKVAKAFLYNHPKSEHYHEALSWFLNLYLIPMFIPEIIDDEQLEFLMSFNGADRYGDKVAPFYRALPIDKIALREWLEIGDDMARNYLKSNVSMENKFKIEQQLLNRDIVQASRWYEGLQKNYNTFENDYWQQFDVVYWESFRLRVENLVMKYSNLEQVSQLVQQFIEFVAQTCHSDYLKGYYWKVFYAVTDQTNSQDNLVGIQAIHTKAKETLRAMEELTEFIPDKTIAMEFTAIDGSQVSLVNLKGKVVLIDFWSTTCTPCLKEMPHLKTIYDKYRSQGFEIIGIAAEGDGAKKNVTNIINKLKVTWPQRLDGGQNATVSYHALYNIKSLPTVWLLDKAGKLVDINARGERLEPLIRKYLDLDN